MLWYFIANPSHYWVPLIANLVVLILCSRFLGHKYRGELKIMNVPVIIAGAAALWPMLDMGILVCCVGWLAGKVIGVLTGKKNSL